MRITASKVGLALQCAYSFRPEVEWMKGTSSHADRGSRFHEAIARYVISGVVEDVEADISAEYANAVAWVKEQGGPQGFQAELAFAWDPVADKAECIGQMSGRDYSKGNGRICGSADLVAVTGVSGYIADWATGSGTGKGPQLRTLALMLQRTHGLMSVVVEALEVTAAGVRSVIHEVLDSFDLDAWAGELADVAASVESSEPTPGSWCGESYCGARLSCPAGQAAHAELVPADALVRRPEWRITDPIETPDQAAWALDVMRLVQARLDAIKDDLKARVPSEGWQLSDGRVLRETKATISYADKDMLLALAKRLGATDYDIESCMRTFDRSNGLRVVGGERPKRSRKGRAA